MANDLHASKIKADKSAQLLSNKASELLEKSEYTSILLRDINAAVITLGDNLIIESWNVFATKIFGITEEDATGHSIANIFENDFHEVFILPAIGDLMQSPNTRLSKDYSVLINNTEHQINVTFSKVSNPQRKIKIVLFINDITDIARIQRLAAWRDVARRIAHEIKNPLTPIRLGTQRMQRRLSHKLESEDSAIFQESTEVILRCVDSITGLVDEFIRFSRMPTPVLKQGSLLHTVQIAVSSFQDNLEGVPVHFHHDPDDSGAKYYCKFDPDQMLRLCVNLISNAVAATKQAQSDGIKPSNGHVTPPVVVRLVSALNAVEIQVCDQGTGVPQPMRARIFEPYFSTKGAGTGLGLVIVQQIAKDHNAKIRLESNVPTGCIFSVAVPQNLETHT